MPRSSVTRDDELLFQPRPGATRDAVSELDEFPRSLDLEPEQASPFLRAQKRVPVRRGPLAKKTANRLKQMLIGLAVVGVIALAASIFYQYGSHSWRFRLRSSDNIEITGAQTVSRRQVLEVFGADLGRNLFFVPLAERRHRLETIPWVESATVVRLLPDRLHVDIQERTPVAFGRIGSRISLIDANGVIMDLPPARARKYSFPVVKGVTESEPLSMRAARMQVYSAVLRELDSEGAHYSHDISEMDLSDPEDVKVVAADPGGAVLVHLGSSDFLRRYKIYIAHLQEWRQQFQKVDSVDLRYDRQIIVNPDSGLRPASARPATAAKAALKPASQTRISKPAAPARKPSPRTAANAGAH